MPSCRTLGCSRIVSSRGDDHVEEEGGETPDYSGKIKSARRLNSKPLTWLAFDRAGRAVGVPLLSFLPAKSKVISALIVVQRTPAKNSDQFRVKHRIRSTVCAPQDESLSRPSCLRVCADASRPGGGGRFLGSLVTQCRRCCLRPVAWSHRPPILVAPARCQVLDTRPVRTRQMRSATVECLDRNIHHRRAFECTFLSRRLASSSRPFVQG